LFLILLSKSTRLSEESVPAAFFISGRNKIIRTCYSVNGRGAFFSFDLSKGKSVGAFALGDRTEKWRNPHPINQHTSPNNPKQVKPNSSKNRGFSTGLSTTVDMESTKSGQKS
jgi:hypothetical protein